MNADKLSILIRVHPRSSVALKLKTKPNLNLDAAVTGSGTAAWSTEATGS